jgi:hypothetical protein
MIKKITFNTHQDRLTRKEVIKGVYHNKIDSNNNIRGIKEDIITEKKKIREEDGEREVEVEAKVKVKVKKARVRVITKIEAEINNNYKIINDNKKFKKKNKAKVKKNKIRKMKKIRHIKINRREIIQNSKKKKKARNIGLNILPVHLLALHLDPLQVLLHHNHHLHHQIDERKKQINKEELRNY